MDKRIKPTKSYHHGDLRRALLDAAEVELIEKGMDKFSLRGIAKRAGVSHAAPAHHFGDMDGLLTALTSISFRRFFEAMRNASEHVSKNTPANCDADPCEKLVAIGLAYIHYAEQNPQMFDLQFTSTRVDHCAPDVEEVAPLSYQYLIDHVNAVLRDKGKSLDNDPDAANAYWALCHGLASLFARTRSNMGDAPSKNEYDARFKAMLHKAAHNL